MWILKNPDDHIYSWTHRPLFLNPLLIFSQDISQLSLVGMDPIKVTASKPCANTLAAKTYKDEVGSYISGPTGNDDTSSPYTTQYEICQLRL